MEHRTRETLTAAAIAAIALGTYAAALRNGFVWDDLVQVLRNPWIHDPGRLGEAFQTHLVGFAPEYSTSYYRPLVHVVHALVYAAVGEAPWAYHLLNVVLHAAVSVCVYALARRCVALPAAAACAVLFAVHPAHVEPVAWVTGIFDPAMALLALLALLAWTDERPRVRMLAPAAFAVALLWKETAVAIAGVVAVHALARRDARRRWRELAAFGAVLGAYLLVRVSALGGIAQGGRNPVRIAPYENLLTGFALLAEHARNLVFPVRLSVVHDLAVVSSPADVRFVVGVVLASVALLAAWRWRRDGWVVLGLALLVLPLLPTMYVPALKDSLYAERYLYLPSAGAALLAALGLERSRVARQVALAAAGVLAAGTLARIPVWHDQVSLWSDAVEKAPGNEVAWESLGAAYATEKRYAEAIPPLRHALQMTPVRPDARATLALCLGATGQRDEATAEAREAVAECPTCSYPNEIFAWLTAGATEDARGGARAASAGR